MVDGGANFSLDIEALVKTRLLINANSGGGKSYLIRKILEVTNGRVQQVVLDLEGEFATLCEKFPYLVVGKGGDIPCQVSTAELLARRILENPGTSVIVDLSELKDHERKRFVKLFLDSMINAPRELWHACLVVVDEAHHFCPQAEEAESEGAVKDLMTRGRKRGLCGILGTQRLSKLNKDAAAECNNVLIGRTVLDTDEARAADILGMNKEGARALRALEPGYFYAFGPAFENGVNEVMISKVETKHIELGMTGFSELPRAAPEKIKAALSNFEDLPQQSQLDLRDRAAVQKEISDLRHKVRTLEAHDGSVSPEKLKEIQDRAFSQGERAGSIAFEKQNKALETMVSQQKRLLQDLATTVAEGIGIETPKFEALPPRQVPAYISMNIPQAKPSPRPVQPTLDEGTGPEYGDSDRPLKGGARRMLSYAKQFHPRPISRDQVAALSGFSARSGTFGDYLSQLKKKGYLVEDSQGLHITEEGSEFAGPVEPLNVDPQQLVEMWASKFKAGTARMLKIIAGRYPEPITREELGQESGFVHTSGTFGDYLSQLVRCGLVIKENGGVIASPNLFLEEQLA